MGKTLTLFSEHIPYFMWRINMLLDDPDQRDQIVFDQMRAKVQAGETIEFLNEQFGPDFGFPSDETWKIAFNNAMSEVSTVLHGRERRKSGVQNNGLCLLLAYTFELMQNHEIQKLHKLV